MPGAALSSAAVGLNCPSMHADWLSHQSADLTAQQKHRQQHAAVEALPHPACLTGKRAHRALAVMAGADGVDQLPPTAQLHHQVHVSVVFKNTLQGSEAAA